MRDTFDMLIWKKEESKIDGQFFTEGGVEEGTTFWWRQYGWSMIDPESWMRRRRLKTKAMSATPTLGFLLYNMLWPSASRWRRRLYKLHYHSQYFLPTLHSIFYPWVPRVFTSVIIFYFTFKIQSLLITRRTGFVKNYDSRVFWKGKYQF